MHNQYHPDYVSRPCETLLETIEYLNISPEELAVRCGLSIETITAVLQDTPMTQDIAKKLEDTLSIPASFWLKLEENYRASL